MEICFQFRTDWSQNGVCWRDKLESHFGELLAGRDAGQFEFIELQKGCCIKLSVDFSDETIAGKLRSSPEFLAVLSLLAETAEQNSFAWQISHEHDEDVGKLAGGHDVRSAIDQISIACEIARLMEDEPLEEISEDLAKPHSVFGGDAEDLWSGLIESHETFVRFPDFEEDDESHDG